MITLHNLYFKMHRPAVIAEVMSTSKCTVFVYGRSVGTHRAAGATGAPLRHWRPRLHATIHQHLIRILLILIYNLLSIPFIRMECYLRTHQFITFSRPFFYIKQISKSKHKPWPMTALSEDYC